MSSTNELVHMIVEHSAWCPMACGEGTRCCCNPELRIVDEAEFVHRVAHDFRNRAQRRADAKRGGKLRP